VWQGLVDNAAKRSGAACGTHQNECLKRAIHLKNCLQRRVHVSAAVNTCSTNATAGTKSLQVDQLGKSTAPVRQQGCCGLRRCAVPARREGLHWRSTLHTHSKRLRLQSTRCRQHPCSTSFTLSTAEDEQEHSSTAWRRMLQGLLMRITTCALIYNTSTACTTARQSQDCLRSPHFEVGQSSGNRCSRFGGRHGE
jgi:hypothetical protein